MNKIASFFSGFMRKSALTTMDLVRLLSGSNRETSSGKTVTTATSIEVSAVFACVRVIGEGIAQVPLYLKRRSRDGLSSVEARDHALFEVLNSRPNEWQTSFEFRETMAWHVVLGGNFYAFKNVLNGVVRELIPFDPGSVQVHREDDLRIWYSVMGQDGTVRPFRADQVWHVKGPSWNGWVGMDAIAAAREAITLAKSTEEQHNMAFKNGVFSSGTYSIEGTLTDVQHKALTKWVKDHAAGVENAGSPMVLDRNAKWMPTNMSGVSAQHLETRRHQIAEICRFFRVNPIMIYGDDKVATFAGAEQNFLSHVVHTLSPWYTRLEQSINANLLSPKERKEGLFSDFDEEALLRGDSKSVSEFLTKLVGGAGGPGIMSQNEARGRLGLNPKVGGDELYEPANSVHKVEDNPPITE